MQTFQANLVLLAFVLQLCTDTFHWTVRAIPILGQGNNAGFVNASVSTFINFYDLFAIKRYVVAFRSLHIQPY